MAFVGNRTRHPDENLLAAFAEQTLPQAERQNVLQHLSSCRHCRDIVFLAQQAAAEEALQAAPALDKSVAGGWWLGRRHWGIVLAGGAVAAMLIVTSLRLYHGTDRGHKPQPSTVAGAKTPTAPVGETAKLGGAENATRENLQLPTGSPEGKDSRHMAGRETKPPRVTVVEPSNIGAAAAPMAGLGTGSTAGRGAGAAGGIGSGSGGNFGGGTYRAGASGGTTGGVPGVPVPAQPQVQAQGAAPTNSMGTIVLQPGQSSTTVEVTSAQPLLNTADAQISTSFSMEKISPTSNRFAIRDGVLQRCIAIACSPIKSPSKEKIISVASDAATVMAIDAKGVLFMSHHQGDHWKKVHTHWQGRPVLVSAIPPPTNQDAVAAASPVPPVSQSQPTQLHIFQLQNDQGQVWLSSDEGKTWRLK